MPLTGPRGWPTACARSLPASPPRSGATCWCWWRGLCWRRDGVLSPALGASWAWSGRSVSAVDHRVLSAGRWSARAVAHRLLAVLVAAFGAEGPVVVGIDDTIERRWGTRIEARGIIAIRGASVAATSSRPAAALAVRDGAGAGAGGRVLGLPFLTVLAPSERYACQRATAQEADRLARQVLLQTARWLPGTARDRGGGQQLLGHRVAAGDRSAPVPGHQAAARRRLTSQCWCGSRARSGVPRVKGARLPSLEEWMGTRPRSGGGWASRAGTAAESAAWTSLPARRSGITLGRGWRCRVLVCDAGGEREPHAFL